MRQSPSLGDGCVAPCQRLVRIAETEKDDRQIRLEMYLRVGPGLIDEGAVRGRIIERKSGLQMRFALPELAAIQQAAGAG